MLDFHGVVLYCNFTNRMKATSDNIREIIAEADILIEVTKLKNDILLKDQGADSLDLANILLLLEEKFKIKIPDQDLDQVQSINAIIEYINNKTS